MGFLSYLLTGLVGMKSIFGIANGNKINHIAEVLQNTIERQDLMIGAIEANFKFIATNRHMLSNLGKVVEVISITVTNDHWKLNGVYLFLLIETDL